jgi:endonuclease YncB( thermonuclease family)
MSEIETGYVVQWVEGDVIEIDVAEGEDIYRRLICRVFGMNAPDSNGVTRDAALRAKERASNLTQDQTLKFIFLELPPTFLVPPRFKKYGRTMVRVFLPAGTEVSDILIEEGMAVPYFMGIGKQPNPLSPAAPPPAPKPRRRRAPHQP